MKIQDSNTTIMSRVRAELERRCQSIISNTKTETPWGPKIYLNPPSKFEVSIANGVYESKELSFFQDRILSNSFTRLADVGAYVGIYGLIFAQESHHVDAFEPVPWTFGRLTRNYLLNDVKSYNIEKAAVTANDGTVELHIDPSLSIEASATGHTYSGGDLTTLSVDAVTLDSYYADREYPDLIKIDTEGAEREVIQGGTQTIQAANALFLEVHKVLMSDHKKELQDIQKMCQDGGFNTAYHLEQDADVALYEVPEIGSEEDERMHLYITE